MSLYKRSFVQMLLDFISVRQACSIVAPLRHEADLTHGRHRLTGQRLPVIIPVRLFAINEQTYYRWRKEYEGLSMDQGYCNMGRRPIDTVEKFIKPVRKEA